ncbi:cupredoxin domain-containing protein [Rhodoblastus sp.]|uniref:cupredoxin domain-containing protein n=1 Tax=Rhodoblastus sp. TaxID=1962975 RepID=UPI0035AEB70A
MTFKIQNPSSQNHRRGVASGSATRRLATFGCACLCLACAPRAASADATPPEFAVTVTAKGCDPVELTVPAGRVSFVIANKSSRSVEWEILDGVMVIDERENIAPGFKSRLTTQLKPGAYQITCGLLDNPRGRLVVTGEGVAKPSAADLVGVAAEYRVGNQRRLADLTDASRRLREAEASGDRDAATRAFLDAQTAFLSTAPIQSAIAEQARPLGDDLTALGGALFADPPRPSGDIATKLDADAARFAAAAAPLIVPANQLVAGALALSRGAVGEIDARPDIAAPLLARLEAQRAAIERIVRLFAPYAKPVDPAAFAALTATLDQMRAELLRPANAAGDGGKARTLSPEQRDALAASARAVAERLAALPGPLGL